MLLNLSGGAGTITASAKRRSYPYGHGGHGFHAGIRHGSSDECGSIWTIESGRVVMGRRLGRGRDQLHHLSLHLEEWWLQCDCYDNGNSNTNYTDTTGTDWTTIIMR